MSDWSDTQWFTAGDIGAVISSTTTVNNSGETAETTNVWSDSSGNGSATSEYTEDVETLATGGSGATPAITVITDYWLRNEVGEIMTDESGSSLSLERV